MKRMESVLSHSEVVFMYAADADAYRAYGATFVGWGGAHTAERVKMHHDLGIRCTGSMWCLTAGAKVLHEDPVLRSAVALDIEGDPVGVPWLFDHTCEGIGSRSIFRRYVYGRWCVCRPNPLSLFPTREWGTESGRTSMPRKEAPHPRNPYPRSVSTGGAR